MLRKRLPKAGHHTKNTTATQKISAAPAADRAARLQNEAALEQKKSIRKMA